MATQFRGVFFFFFFFFGKKSEFKQTFITRNLSGNRHKFELAANVNEKNAFLSGSWNLCRVAILVTEHVAFKTTILLFKPF